MRCIAFLRAINVAGHATVKMVDLKQAFVSAGCRDVETCIQSGNVIFQSPGAGNAPTGALVGALKALLGAEPVLMVRTERELTELEQSAPFTRTSVAGDAKLYVVFLARKPARRPALPLTLPKEGLETIAMTDREAFVVSPRKKTGFYGFPNAFIEAAPGVLVSSNHGYQDRRALEAIISRQSSIASQGSRRNSPSRFVVSSNRTRTSKISGSKPGARTSIR